MSLEKNIEDAWHYYRQVSQKCHQIAERVKRRKVDGIAYGYALPGETELYDHYAKELRGIEEYIAVRQKELNRRNPRFKQDNYAFNSQQLEQLRNEFTHDNWWV